MSGPARFGSQVGCCEQSDGPASPAALKNQMPASATFCSAASDAAISSGCHVGKQGPKLSDTTSTRWPSVSDPSTSAWAAAARSWWMSATTIT